MNKAAFTPNTHARTHTHYQQHTHVLRDRHKVALAQHSARTCRLDHVKVGKLLLVACLTEQLPVVLRHGHRLQGFVALGTLEAQLVELSTGSEHLFVHVHRLITVSALGTASVAHSALLCSLHGLYRQRSAGTLTTGHLASRFYGFGGESFSPLKIPLVRSATSMSS